MAGHVYKTAKAWRAQVSVRDPRTGKRHQRRIGPFRTRREAEQAVALELAKVDPIGSETTVERYLLDRWLPARRARDLKPTTLQDYEWNVTNLILPRLGHRRLGDLTGAVVVAFVIDLSETISQRGKPYSSETVKGAHRVLSMALKDAFRWGLISRDIADDARADLPRRERPKARDWWTPDQLRAFLDFVRDDETFALWMLCCTTGGRRGEPAGSRWNLLDLDDGVWYVHRSTVMAGATIIEQESVKTSSSYRQIRLDPATVAALRAHRARQQAVLGDKWREDGAVFLGANGKAMRPDGITSRFTRRARRAGLPHISLHGLRHSYVTAAKRAGVPSEVVADRLGHADDRITRDVYSHMDDVLDADAANRIADLILGTGPEPDDAGHSDGSDDLDDSDEQKD